MSSASVRIKLRLLRFAIILALTAGPLSASAQQAQDRRPPKDAITNVRVVDQDGKRINFYEDLVKGRVVAINFIYTTCTAICPMQGNQFARLQTMLGDRLGKDVMLISISADPEADSAQKLKTWLSHFGSKQGWTFVTGEKSEIDRLSRALTGDQARKGDHSPAMFIGNYDKGVWKRVYGLAEPERLTRLIGEMSADH
ncbi:MAG TPA: SCO family protein [Blastocatellia bacterium]|nr:SCO family protein [Blastocatellia bacterium]